MTRFWKIVGEGSGWRKIVVSLFLLAASSVSAQPPTTPSTCDNLDFSRGNFTGWTGRTTVYPSTWPDANNCNPANNTFVTCPNGSGQSCNGCYSFLGTPVPQPSGALGPIPWYNNNGIVNGRHTIVTTSVPDPYACNNILTLPPGEPFCARLGNGGVGAWGNGVGWQIDYLSYTFTVGPQNSLLTYKYAVVLQDPLRDPNNPKHAPGIRPRFNVYIRNAAGNLIDPTCGKFEVVYDTTLTGFRECPLTQIQSFGGNPYASVGTAYRAWTTVGVDLRAFIGQTISIEFNTWDCGWGGHFGYAYVTARCDSLGIQQSGCNPDGSVRLTAPPGFAYQWFPGNETTQSIDVKNASPGDTIRVTLTTNNGCMTDLYTVVYPTVTEAVASATPSPVCVNQTVTFKDSSYSFYTGNMASVPMVSWNWTFGDGGTSTLKNPTHVYTTPGNYTVRLLATNRDGCTDTIVIPVVVLAKPAANFTVQDVCIGSPVAFTDLSTSSDGPITSWNWDFGNGQTSTLQTPSQIYSSPGTYTVRLSVAMALTGCNDDTVRTVKVWPEPRAQFTGNTVCLGNPTIFSNQSASGDPLDPILGWVWAFGDSTPMFSGPLPYHVYKSAGTFTVTLSVTTQRGCKHDTSITVKVLPTPKADFRSSGVCLGTPYNFTDLSSPIGTVAIWNWSFGDGTPGSAVQNPVHTYNAAGYYDVKLWVSTVDGCVDSIVKKVDIHPLPEVDFNSDKYEGCAPLCVVFSDLSYSPYDTINKWEWTFGDGNVSGLPAPPHCYPNPGVYSVSLAVTTKQGCKQSWSWPNMIRVYPHPKADFTFVPDETTEMDPKFEFTDQSSGSVYWTWYFGDSTSSGDQNPIHLYQRAGEYIVWQIVRNQYDCLDSIFKKVKITPEWTFYIPNAFSPNGNGKNDGFIGKSWNVIEHQMWIFDRWGDQVYKTEKTKDPESAIPWNGHVNDGDNRAEEDVYIWVVKLRDIFGRHHRYVGTVTLIR